MGIFHGSMNRSSLHLHSLVPMLYFCHYYHSITEWFRLGWKEP